MGTLADYSHLAALGYGGSTPPQLQMANAAANLALGDNTNNTGGGSTGQPGAANTGQPNTVYTGPYPNPYTPRPDPGTYRYDPSNNMVTTTSYGRSGTPITITQQAGGALYTADTGGPKPFYRDKFGNLISGGMDDTTQWGFSDKGATPQSKFNAWLNGLGATPQQKQKIYDAQLAMINRGQPADMVSLASHILMGGDYNTAAGTFLDAQGRDLGSQRMVDVYRGRAPYAPLPGDIAYAGSATDRYNQAYQDWQKEREHIMQYGVTTTGQVPNYGGGYTGPTPAPAVDTYGPGSHAIGVGSGGGVFRPGDSGGRDPATGGQADGAGTGDEGRDPNDMGGDQRPDTTGQGSDETGGNGLTTAATQQTRNTPGSYANPGVSTAGYNTGGSRPGFASSGGNGRRLPIYTSGGGQFRWGG